MKEFSGIIENRNWRPEDWDKNKPFFHVSRSKEYCYEAGADAMLKALFKLAVESPTKTFTIDSRVINIYEVKNED